MVRYTSARAIADLNYQLKGNSDLRLFLLFGGGVLTYIHPISVLFTLFILALMTKYNCNASVYTIVEDVS